MNFVIKFLCGGKGGGGGFKILRMKNDLGAKTA